MPIQLVVTEPFGTYDRGAIITDPKTINDILVSELADHVVKTQCLDTPTNAPKDAG